MKFRPISILACCSALALGACQSTGGVSCPPLASYTPAQAKAIGAELRKLPASDSMAQVIVDYRNLRRACGAK